MGKNKKSIFGSVNILLCCGHVNNEHVNYNIIFNLNNKKKIKHLERHQEQLRFETGTFKYRGCQIVNIVLTSFKFLAFSFTSEDGQPGPKLLNELFKKKKCIHIF